MSVMNEALKKASLARRVDEPAQVLFEPSAALAQTPKASATLASKLFPILLVVASLLLAGYAAFLYQARQAETGLRIAAETRFAEQSEILGQKALELETVKADLESLSLQNAALEKTVTAQEDEIAAGVSDQARLTGRLRTLFKALFASRSQARQYKKESASKEKTIALLVGELSRSKESAVSPQA